MGVEREGGFGQRGRRGGKERRGLREATTTRYGDTKRLRVREVRRCCPMRYGKWRPNVREYELRSSTIWLRPGFGFNSLRTYECKLGLMTAHVTSTPSNVLSRFRRA
eukprot:3232771-Pleurochrysis_carterae.AAC.1